MKAIKPLLLSLSMLALAWGTAQANDAKNKSDAQAKPSMSQGGSASAGSSTGGSASAGSSAAKDSKSPSASAGASGTGSAAARYDFDKADKNKDGQLSRTEFNDMMKGGASAGATSSGTSGSSASTAGASGSSSAKTQTPSSGKMDDKPKSSK
jgi:hypothetical protein